jgi:hypothetical protein
MVLPIPFQVGWFSTLFLAYFLGLELLDIREKEHLFFFLIVEGNISAFYT